MKTIKTILIFCTALCFIISCKKEPDMTLRQKTAYENNDISLFHIDDAWDVSFVYDSLNSYVELEYSAYLEEYVSVWDTNGWLNIGFRGSVYKQPGSVFKAKVHTSEKEHLYMKVEDASVITMEGVFRLEDGLDIELHDGSVCNGFAVTSQWSSISLTHDSQIYGVDYHGTNCAVYAQKGSSCKGYFHVEESFTADVGVSSQLIVFGGNIPSASIEVKNESTINMVQAEVQNMSVYLEGASEATVNVSERIEGSVKEASTLYYKGHPQIDVECSEDSHLISF